MSYALTQRVQLAVTFRDLAGALVNPTTVTLLVKAPDGTLSTPIVTNDGPGVYSAPLDLSQVGIWSYAWRSTGTLVSASEGAILVNESVIGSEA